MYYILEDRKPVEVYDIMKWGKHESLKTENKRVARDAINDSIVSTVFLGIDHGRGIGDPVLFETMVFEGPLDGEMERCCTWEEAEAMHKKMIDRVKDSYK